jgi:hypothetical protein
MAQVEPPFRIIRVSGRDQAEDATSARSHDDGQVSTAVGLPDHTEAPLPRPRHERVAIDHLLDLFDADRVDGDVVFAIRLDDELKNPHRTEAF